MYYITEDGKCFNQITQKFLKGQVGKNGYHNYYLTLPDGSRKRVYTHRLVGDAYLQKPTHRHNQINHKDGNKLNNCADNLEWVTPQENQRHALQMDLRSYCHVFCFNPNQELVAEYKNTPEAARAVGISSSLVQQELKKTPKTLSGGFYWSDTPHLGPVKNYTNHGRAKRVNQYSLAGKYITSYESTGQAARALGIKNSSHIGECCRGKIKTFKNFIWKYADDIVSPSLKNEESIANTIR